MEEVERIPDDLMSLTDVKSVLGIGERTMRRLLRAGMLKEYSHELDRRIKLVSRRQVLALRPRLYTDRVPRTFAVLPDDAGTSLSR